MIAVLLILGCQPKIKGDVDVKVQPIEVKHTISLDTDKLEDYYRTECSQLYTVQQDIENCVNQKMTDFLQAFTY